MTSLWKTLSGILYEKNFKAKTTTTAAEGKCDGTEDRRCDDKTTCDTQRPERSRSTVRCSTATYDATSSDFYIGVDSCTASTIYLPTAVGDGKIIVVKAEMKPPLYNRKITIKTKDGSTIDGYSETTLQVSHMYKSLIRVDGQWYIIGG